MAGIFFGEDTEVTRAFRAIQAQVLLRPTGELLVGHIISFLGRQLTHKGEYIEITLGDKDMTNLLEEQDMYNSRPVNTPGTAALKTTRNEAALTPDKHKQYRRAVGKLQWMTDTRPDICCNKGASTRSHCTHDAQPTEAETIGNQKPQLHRENAMRYRSTSTQAQAGPGCPATRKSTTGFVI